MTDLAGLTVAFRADASLQIGTGHVMRCLTLADALRRRGASCRFVCRAHEGHLIERVARQGHAVDALPVGPTMPEASASPTHAAWLGADWHTDAQQTIEALGKLRPDWIVVDHYALDARWEKAVQAHTAHLLAIDDLADRPHHCDLLLDQNLGRAPNAYAAQVPPQCRLLTGPQFALLRPEFAEEREHSLQRRATPQLKQLLVTMGGVDGPNATGAILEALLSCPLPDDCRITVVTGAGAPALETVRLLAARMPRPTEVIVDATDMAQRMALSDLAIGAAGGTAWERCCLGLPTLLVVVADNQVPGARALEAVGAAVLLGDTNAVAQALPAALSRTALSTELARMAQAASRVTDGLGANRVIASMVNSNV